MNRYDEERLAADLQALRPPPERWVRAAQLHPFAEDDVVAHALAAEAKVEPRAPAADRIFETRLSDLLDELASPAGRGAEAAAAALLAMAAALVSKSARLSAERGHEAAGVVAQAEALRARIARLAARGPAAAEWIAEAAADIGELAALAGEWEEGRSDAAAAAALAEAAALAAAP